MNRIWPMTCALFCFTVSAIAADAPPATAQSTQPTTPTSPTMITLGRSPMPAPAMKYRLLPDALDLQPGNAATLYLVATNHNLIGNAQPWVEDAPIDEWLTMPIERLPRRDAEKYVEHFHNPLHQVELGARRETCHWDLPYRQDGFGTLLPYLSDLRMLAKVIALKARLQIADGKYEHAAYTLQTGFGLARHLDQWEAFLIQMLVAASIQDMMLEQVEFWISREGSPNLTWSLVNLPRPMVNLQGGLEYERAGIGYAVPELKTAAAGKLTAEGLESMFGHMHFAEMSEPDALPPAADIVRRVASDLAGAKAYLVGEVGYKQAEVDAMQPPAVLGLYYAKSFEQWHDDALKWYGLPYPQAAKGLAQSLKEFEKFRASHVDNPTFKGIVVYQRILLKAHRIDRRVDELRCLEAIRAYATAQDGKLPAKLADVTEAPVPADVITGGSFGYTSRENGVAARLEAPVPEGGEGKDGRVYEIQGRK